VNVKRRSILKAFSLLFVVIWLMALTVSAVAEARGNWQVHLNIVVWSKKVPKPITVRYVWADNPICNFYRQAGLPAFLFVRRYPIITKFHGSNFINKPVCDGSRDLM
jgi:hypothetical protein